VHSHLSESKAEIAWVKELHPEAETYADVYKDHGLLHERSYMAHCVHCGRLEESR
jgi:guanine deaminase